MTEEEYHDAFNNRLDTEALSRAIMEAQQAAVETLSREQADFIGTACYPYDIDKPGNPPMKQANARVIEPSALPEK